MNGSTLRPAYRAQLVPIRDQRALRGRITAFLLLNYAGQVDENVGSSALTPAPAAETVTYSLDYHRGTETILLVDDEAPLRNVLVDMLGQLGYRVLAAAGGQEALKLAKEYSGRIDLLLTDVVMDGLPGPELAELLLRSRPEMKVVYISGYPDNSLAPNGVLKPGTVLVAKPFSLKVLSAKLREVLGSPSAA